MRKNRDKGVTIIELIVAITIIGFITIISCGSYMKIKENNEIIKSKLLMVNTVSRYRDLSYLKEKDHLIVFDFFNKKILISDKLSNLLEEIELPKGIEYRIISKDKSTYYHKTNMTKTGNLGSSFTIYIFNSNELAKYRIAFYSFSTMKYLFINVYSNRSANEAIFKSIKEYHETEKSQNHIGWLKEGI